MPEPSYVSLYNSGELEHRAQALETRLADCDICPHDCGKDRLQGQTGFCHSGALPVIASVCAHNGEEPPISGTRGSGTIFFGNCNMRCVYCQNFQISQNRHEMKSKEVDCLTLAEKMLYLQDEFHCHNINFVSPSHFVPQIVRALVLAVPLGLRIPLVYNSGGYDSLETIKSLDGIIDIYLPDIRYALNKNAMRYSCAPRYVESSRAAIKEMYRQVGNLQTDEEGIAVRGLIVRHLILPDGIAGSEESLKWLASELSPDVTVSIMAQYYPTHQSARHPELNRRINRLEFDEVTALLDRLGMENGWVQELESSDNYRPDFAREGHPFE